MSAFELDLETGCWLWTGARHPKGYGKSNGRPAHRVIYEEYRGAIPLGYHLHHVCEVKHCVNPNHMQVVSPGEHMQLHDISAKGVAVHAKNRREKTHCKHGHEFTPENTRVYKGKRKCLACSLERDRRYRACR